MRISFRHGAIAQLGERLHGMQEVGGSIPPSSTKFLILKVCVSPSSRGLGHRPFTAVTGVRIPVGTPRKSIACNQQAIFLLPCPQHVPKTFRGPHRYTSLSSTLALQDAKEYRWRRRQRVSRCHWQTLEQRIQQKFHCVFWPCLTNTSNCSMGTGLPNMYP